MLKEKRIVKKENSKSFLSHSCLVNQIFNEARLYLRSWDDGILITVDFTDYFLNIRCPWRIEDKNKVLVGWTQNKDCFEDIQRLLNGKKIVKVKLDKKTSDLILYFEQEIILRTFAHSTAFEQWHLEEKVSRAFIEAIGAGDICCCEGIKPSSGQKGTTS